MDPLFQIRVPDRSAGEPEQPHLWPILVVTIA